MNDGIRVAITADAEHFLAIKKQLPLQIPNSETSSGGFLLGTDIATYRYFIENAYCLVAQSKGDVVGFGILLPDRLLRKSDLWLRRHQVNWEIDLNGYSAKPICYFEQLAFLPGHRRLAIALAYHMVLTAFAEGHTLLITTTVRKPVCNLAAVPFLLAAGGHKVGCIDEVYPDIGAILSDLYFLEADVFLAAAKSHPLYDFVQRYHISKR